MYVGLDFLQVLEVGLDRLISFYIYVLNFGIFAISGIFGVFIFVFRIS